MKATRDAYGEALVELGGSNTRVVVLDADLSQSTKSAGFAEKYPERFFNMGVAEADMIGTAAGLATAGKIPFASTFAVFATGRVYDQIRNSVAYPNLSVNIAGSHGGITVGEDGASHQALEDLALMRALPNMTVICPADGREAYRATLASARWEGPVYLRLGRPKVPEVTGEETPFEIGKGVELRPGEDLTIVSTGIMTGVALETASILESKNVQARVLHMHTLKPLDEELLVQAARETGLLFTLEEHSVIGGLGSAVAETVTFRYPVPVIRCGIPDCFGESGSPDELLDRYGLTAEKVSQGIEGRFKEA